MNGDNFTYWAFPENREGPGVLVLHAWWGLNDFFKGVCDRIAQEGYVACAPDLYGGKIAATPQDALKLESQSDREEIDRQIISAAKMLRSHPAVIGAGSAVLGFSLGAYYALELAVHPELGFIRAAVLFYGTNPNVQADQYSRSRAAFLGHFAEIDEFESPEDVAKTSKDIQLAGRPVQFYTYPGTQHWFAESNRTDVYNHDAASLAWDRTCEFLNQHLNQNR